VTLDQIDIQNRRRLVRAVEVIRLTGKPFSLQRAKWPEQGGPATAGRAFGIQRDRQDLVRRIHERVERMFAAGLIAETQERLQQGLRENRTAMQAIGYRQVVEHLEGLMSLRATLERVQIKTRQYAKRQMTWLRKETEAFQLETEDWLLKQKALQRVAEFLAASESANPTEPT
jgi:tRNA dimethylallyltransferase